MNGTECRPQAPVAEGGSEIVRVADRGATGGTDGTGSPGAGGVRAASGRLKSDVKLFNAFVLNGREPIFVKIVGLTPTMIESLWTVC